MINRAEIITKSAMASILVKDFQKLAQTHTSSPPTFIPEIVELIQRCYRKSCELQAVVAELQRIVDGKPS